MWDGISQIALSILSPMAIILVAKKNKWGFVIGLATQPFWFITSLTNQQWGVFFVSLLYTGSWALGIYEWFFKKENMNPLVTELSKLKEEEND